MAATGQHKHCIAGAWASSHACSPAAMAAPSLPYQDSTDMALNMATAQLTEERLRKYYNRYLQDWQQHHNKRNAVIEMINGSAVEMQPCTFEHFCTIWHRLEHEY